MLTGQQPFRGSTQNEILYQVISVEPPAPRSLRPEIPAELERNSQFLADQAKFFRS